IGDRESNKLTTHPLTGNRTRVLPPLSKLDPLHSKAQGTLPSFWEDISTLPLTLASTNLEPTAVEVSIDRGGETEATHRLHTAKSHTGYQGDTQRPVQRR